MFVEGARPAITPCPVRGIAVGVLRAACPAAVVATRIRPAVDTSTAYAASIRTAPALNQIVAVAAIRRADCAVVIGVAGPKTIAETILSATGSACIIALIVRICVVDDKAAGTV